jgi:hypothetical protein
MPWRRDSRDIAGLWQDVADPTLSDEDRHFFYAAEFTVINRSVR